MGREALASAGEAEAVGRRRTDGDAVGRHAERLGEAGLHPAADRRDVRALADEDAVGVHELEPGLADDRVGVLEEAERRRAPPLRIAGRESVPMSPSPAAPSSASTSACVSTSPSE